MARSGDQSVMQIEVATETLRAIYEPEVKRIFRRADIHITNCDIYITDCDICQGRACDPNTDKAYRPAPADSVCFKRWKRPRRNFRVRRVFGGWRRCGPGVTRGRGDRDSWTCSCW